MLQRWGDLRVPCEDASNMSKVHKIVIPEALQARTYIFEVWKGFLVWNHLVLSGETCPIYSNFHSFIYQQKWVQVVKILRKLPSYTTHVGFYMGHIQSISNCNITFGNPVCFEIWTLKNQRKPQKLYIYQKIISSWMCLIYFRSV